MLALLAGVVVGAVAGMRSVYFVGQDDRGLVTLYRGVPYELPLGIDLYEPEYVSSVPARTLSPIERRRLLDHQLRSREDAADIVRELERGQAVSARNRELLGLFPVSLLVTAGFTGRLRGAPGRPRLGHAHLRRRSSWCCAWPCTCSSAPRSRTPTRTCSRWSRCWRPSAS